MPTATISTLGIVSLRTTRGYAKRTSASKAARGFDHRARAQLGDSSGRGMRRARALALPRQALDESARNARPSPSASAFFRILPTRGARPAVEIATRTGPAFAIAAIATKP